MAFSIYERPTVITPVLLLHEHLPGRERIRLSKGDLGRRLAVVKKVGPTGDDANCVKAREIQGRGRGRSRNRGPDRTRADACEACRLAQESWKAWK